MTNYCKKCGNKLCHRSNRHKVTGLCKTCYNQNIHTTRRKTNHDPHLTEFKKLLKERLIKKTPKNHRDRCTT